MAMAAAPLFRAGSSDFVGGGARTRAACKSWQFMLRCAMSIDVVDLRNFYTQRLGVVARRFVGRGIRKHFADTRGMSVLGVGYATPYLGLFREEAERCLAFMPAAQGVVKWPTDRPSLAALVDELELPLPDAAVDRVLLVHALEMAHDPAGPAARGLAGAGSGRAAARGCAEPARSMGPPRYHAVRARPALFAVSDHTAPARGLVHADRMGRGAARAAGRSRLVPAIGGGMGTGGLGDRRTVCGGAHRRSNQAGLPGNSGAARAGAVWCRRWSPCSRLHRAACKA